MGLVLAKLERNGKYSKDSCQQRKVQITLSMHVHEIKLNDPADMQWEGRRRNWQGKLKVIPRFSINIPRVN